MAPLRQLTVALLCSLALACGDDDPLPASDAGTPGLDGSMSQDAASEAGPPEDAATADSGVAPEDAAAASDSGHDGSIDDGSIDDGGERDATVDAALPGVTYAVLGERCAPSERVGLVQVQSEGGGPASLLGAIYDRPNAGIGAPALSDDACDFYRAAMQVGACASCDYAFEVCSASSTCALAQQPVDDTVVTLTKGASSQTFAHEPGDSPGFVYGALELESPFGLEVRWGEHTVVMAEHAFPMGLTNPAGSVTESYDADIAWSGASDGFVFTHVPMNHHVGGLTFTECAVEASAGALHIDGAMLAPLALVTGLEFQGIEHVVFAAAETDAGCVELRYSVRYYVSL